jgi:hypothetical protein
VLAVPPVRAAKESSEAGSTVDRSDAWDRIHHDTAFPPRANGELPAASAALNAPYESAGRNGQGRRSPHVTAKHVRPFSAVMAILRWPSFGQSRCASTNNETARLLAAHEGNKSSALAAHLVHVAAACIPAQHRGAA